ncbi:MAG: hypothetical protein ABIS69_03125 [Sediminibacterium sp.]
MKFLPAFFFVLLVIASSCNEHPPKAGTVKVDDTAKFYPLKDFFKEQIQYVDLRNFSLYRIIIKDGKKDSVSINKEQFIDLASIFLNKEKSFSKEKASFKESAFTDLSTESVTFTYQSIDSKTEIQNITILLDEQTQLVKRVFIRSEYTKGDTSFTEQCNWKAGKSFQVNRTLTAKTGYTSTERNYINWNDTP